MISFFNSEFATVTVNLVVIVALLFFVYFVLKKYLPSLSGEKLKDQLKTSTTSQNVFAFLSVVITSTFLDLFTSGNYHMLWSVVVISILTLLFNFLYEKVIHKNEEIDNKAEYNRGLNLIEQIINCKGYGLIKDADAIGEIENKAQEIYVFTENLITDIPKEHIDEKYENIGLFVEPVAQNIPNNKRYIYFLKDNELNRKYQKEYCKYHFKGEKEKFKKNVSFYFIDEREFCFFSELYLYKTFDKHDRAFEWIPSIGEKNNPNKQFYLELSSEQTQNINEIICELMVSSQKFTANGDENEF